MKGEGVLDDRRRMVIREFCYVCRIVRSERLDGEEEPFDEAVGV